MKPTFMMLAALTALLAACGQTTTGTGSTPVTTAPSTGSAAPLASQAVGSSIALQAGQTRQITVTVNGAPAQPGQLTWTTGNAGVATVTSSGLVTAVAAGSTTVRAALSSNPAAFLDFPVAVAAASTPAPTPTPAPAPTPGTGSGISATEQRVLDLTNQARAQARTCGTTSYPAAPALSWNASLATAARGHATDMAAKNYFSHTSQDGRTFDVRIRNAGYTGYRTIGENIAAGQPTPDAVVAGWLASPGHCANIMNASFKELGVGVGTGGSYGTYWVQDFGARS
ncbi:CAP domain-containing protein [Deinococcus aquiradiocola]|nr:CAP domain-containing protein [Deinococcus aquiradiocola]